MISNTPARVSIRVAALSAALVSPITSCNSAKAAAAPSPPSAPNSIKPIAAPIASLPKMVRNATLRCSSLKSLKESCKIWATSPIPFKLPSASKNALAPSSVMIPSSFIAPAAEPVVGARRNNKFFNAVPACAPLLNPGDMADMVVLNSLNGTPEEAATAPPLARARAKSSMENLEDVVTATMPSTAPSISSALILKIAIASVAMLAALERSAPVALASKTVLLAAPSKICVMSKPLRASISIACPASTAVTFNVGSSPKSRIKSPSSPTASMGLFITAAMLAICCSISIAALTPFTDMRTKPAAAAAKPATNAPLIMPASRSAPELNEVNDADMRVAPAAVLPSMPAIERLYSATEARNAPIFITASNPILLLAAIRSLSQFKQSDSNNQAN